MPIKKKKKRSLIEGKMICLLYDYFSGNIPKKDFDELDEPLWRFLVHKEKSSYRVFVQKPTQLEIDEIIKDGCTNREIKDLEDLKRKLGKLLVSKTQKQTQLSL